MNYWPDKLIPSTDVHFMFKKNQSKINICAQNCIYIKYMLYLKVIKYVIARTME